MLRYKASAAFDDEDLPEPSDVFAVQEEFLLLWRIIRLKGSKLDPCSSPKICLSLLHRASNSEVLSMSESI